jgi:FkbM family methyltransferase
MFWTSGFRRLPIPLRPAVNWLARLRGLELIAIPPNGMERSLYDALCPGGDIRVIFDVGANVGNAARQFSSSFPAASIYCFEPVTSTYEQLRATTADKPNIYCFQFAMGEVAQTAYIKLEQNSEFNQIVDGDPTRNFPKEQIEVITIDRFCETRGIPRIDIIKTDTEGYDLHVLRGASDMLRSGVRFVLSEVGMARWDTRHTYFQDINDFLCDYSFHLSGFYGTLYRADGTIEFTNALFVRAGT